MLNSYCKNTQWESLETDLRLYYEIKVLYACMTLRIPAKKKILDPYMRKIYSSFYDVLYKFSHRKLKTFVTRDFFKVAFRHYVNSREVDAMLNDNTTLAIHPKEYKEMIESIARLCEEEN